MTKTEDVCSIGLGLASTLAMPIVLQDMGIEAEYVTCLLPNEHEDAYRLMRKQFPYMGCGSLHRGQRAKYLILLMPLRCLMNGFFMGHFVLF